MAKNFFANAKSWAAKNKLLGPQAFLKYVIFTYLDALNKQSDEFIFKGGNLLWTYIRTPRATVDLDLSTLEDDDDKTVKAALAKVTASAGIEFKLESFKGIEQRGKRGAAVTISYKTDSGAKNKFDIDIVYAAPIDFTEIDSPIEGATEIKAASIENIIGDKLAAVQRFKGGNTRIKDFDDLWRISTSKQSVDTKKLKSLLSSRKISPRLEKAWIGDEMNRAWKTHQARYKDLPKNLETLFLSVNKWLAGLGID